MSELFEKTRVRLFPDHMTRLLSTDYQLGSPDSFSDESLTDSVVLQKIEARVAADEDLKLADLLKYYLRESQAAKV